MSSLTLRDRFYAQMGSTPDVAVPNFEFGYWEATLPNWHKQGLPKEIDRAAKAYEYFGIEGLHFAEGFHLPGWNTRLCPKFEQRCLGEEDGVVTFIDGDGVKFTKFSEGQNSIPHYLAYPIKDRHDWYERYKPRLNPNTEARFPIPEPDWTAVAETFKKSGKPSYLYLDSYMGYLRNLMGFETFSMLPYDDPELFEDMVETLTQIKERIIDRISGKFQIDMVQYWEDICFNSGPIISPKAFYDVVVPRMKRVNDRLRNELGVKFISLDCDGDILALLDGWIEAGVNILLPCENDAGMDIHMLQERFGDRCGFHGGIQKKSLIDGPDAIRKELRRILPAVQNGGYIPHLDHACPANASLDNYRFYLQLKRDLLGCGCALSKDEDERDGN